MTERLRDLAITTFPDPPSVLAVDGSLVKDGGADAGTLDIMLAPPRGVPCDHPLWLSRRRPFAEEARQFTGGTVTVIDLPGDGGRRMRDLLIVLPECYAP